MSIRVRFSLTCLLGALVPACAEPPDLVATSSATSQPVSYARASIFGIHTYPNPDAAPPDWLGSGTRNLWVTELAASGDSYNWFHYQATPGHYTCPANTTCGRLAKIATRNTRVIARIDYKLGSPGDSTFYSVPQTQPQIDQWKQVVHDKLFTSDDQSPITRFANIILVGNEVNNCIENNVAKSTCDLDPAQKWTAPYQHTDGGTTLPGYAEVYRQLRAHIHAEANLTSYPDVSVMLAAPTPGGYGGVHYIKYVLDHLCGDTVDAIALHAYGFGLGSSTPAGSDGTYGLSGSLVAQLHEIDESCNGKFRNTPVVVTEFSGGDQPLQQDSNLVGNVYQWINGWNADSTHHPIAGATYFHAAPGGSGFGFDYENITLDSPNSHVMSRAAFKTAVASDWRSREGGAPTTPLPVDNQCSMGGASRTFSETGYTASGPIYTYWASNNGMTVFGLPISNARMETNTSGNNVCTQWFERQRLEINAANAIDLGLLGTERRLENYTMIGGAWNPVPSFPSSSTCTYFAPTGHSMCNGFKGYWEQNGGLARFGYPWTQEFTYTGSDGKSYTAQYFERARFEWHPENAPPYDILQGRLGAELYLDQR